MRGKSEKIIKNSENSVKFAQKSASEVIWGSQMVKIGLKGCQGTAKGRPSDPKVGPRRPKVAPRMAKWGALGGKNGAQGTPREAFWRQNVVKNQIFVDFGEYFYEKVDFAEFIVLLK